MKKIELYLPSSLGVVMVALLCFSCRTLYTTVNFPTSSSFNGILYYLPIGKITIRGEFKEAEEKKAEQQSVTIGSASELTITLTPEVEPDGSRVLYARPEFNPLYEDEVKA